MANKERRLHLIWGEVVRRNEASQPNDILRRQLRSRHAELLPPINSGVFGARYVWSTVAELVNVPGWGLHPLKDNLKGHGAVLVSGNWRMTFLFDDDDAVLVDYQDHHPG